jgi:methanogenic corrinoid protein MtbC1
MLFNAGVGLFKRRRKCSLEAVDTLLRVLEREIILKQRSDQTQSLEAWPAEVKEPEDHCPFPDDVLNLTQLLLDQQRDAAMSLAVQRCQDGVPLTSIYLNLLGPCAVHLGELWEQDRCDFNAVTLAVGHLQAMMRQLEESSTGLNEVSGQHHRILLMPVPGDQHTFGLSMLGDFFRHAGWDVWGGPAVNEDRLLVLIEEHDFDVVGLSASCERWLDRVRSIVPAIRAASSNPDTKILVGGELFRQRPQLVSELAIDGTAADASAAVQLATSMVQAPSAASSAK